MKAVESIARDRFWQRIQAATGLLFALVVFSHLGSAISSE
jgi:hypothetical protein